MLKRYNPKQINSGWDPSANGRDTHITFEGFMDGTFLDIEFAEDAVTVHVGADGTVTYVLNANRTATATVTLVQGADANTPLSRQVPDARRDFLPIGPFNVNDLNGDTLVTSNKAVLVKTAKIEFGKTVTGRQWKFSLHDAEIVAGGDDS